MKKIFFTFLLLGSTSAFAGNNPPPPGGAPTPPGLPINQYEIILFLIGILMIFIFQKKVAIKNKF